MMGNVIQAHDQTIFQLIASLNAVQAIILDKELTTKDELVEATQKELTKMQENFMKDLKEKEEKGQFYEEEMDGSRRRRNKEEVCRFSCPGQVS